MNWKTMVAVLMILATILCGCGGSIEETPTPQVSAIAQPAPQVSVKGKAVPGIWAAVSAQTSGTVLEVLVKPGDEAAAGDLLVRLDSADAQLAVQRAEATLAIRQADLALLKAGPRPQEIAVTEAEVEAAQAALSQAAAQRDQLKAGTTEAEIAAAQAELASAQAKHLAARQTHDQTMDCRTIRLPDGKTRRICPLLGSVEERARYDLHAAEESLAAAQAQVDALTAGADDRIRAADAAAWAAEAQLGVSQAQLELLKAGAAHEEIAVAEATVVQAEAALAEAQMALGRCEIRALFAGTVGAVHTRMGELVALGQSLVTLGDLSTLRVETTDLDDVDVARVTIGQPAVVSFAALPGQDFTGRVTLISPMAEPDRVGGYNYTVVIELDEIVPQIRWGMDAFVSIETQ